MRYYVTCVRLALSLGAAVTLGCGSDSPPPAPTPTCTFTVNASQTSFGPSAGTGSITVATDNRCSWTATATAGEGWIAVTSGATGAGPGTATFSVTANPGQDVRTGALAVAGHQITITQTAAPADCTYALSPASASISKASATGTFSVATGAGCTWTATSSDAWLTVTGGSPGTGNGTVTYSATENRGIPVRMGTIAVAGATFRLTQAGDPGACQYSVSPVEFAPCMPATEMTSQIVTEADCPWDVTPAAGWITLLSETRGSGSTAVRFRITDNYDAPRLGIVEIRWPAPTAGQNLRINQAGCTYATSADNFAFTAAGGTGRFDVITMALPNTCGGPLQNACIWSAVSDASWITVTSSMPRAGDEPVNFTVAPNDAAASRAGTIVVRDKVVRITQAGR